MASSIGRGDPEYATAMREAKALFEAAMAKGAMKGGRPRAAAAAPAAAAVVAAPTEAEDDVDMSDVIAEATGEVPAPQAAAPAPAPAAPAAPAAKTAPARKPRRRAKGESA